MPWEENEMTRCGLKGRETSVGFDSPSSRGLSGRMPELGLSPRASAFGLSPGLGSAGPSGRILLEALNARPIAPLE